MKFVYLIATTVLPFFVSLSGLTQVSNACKSCDYEHSYAPREKQPLRLTSNLISQRYCREPDSENSDNLRMKLQLRYVNSGPHPLILYKYDNTVSRTMVSRDPADATVERYIWDLSLTTVTGGKNVTIDSLAPSSSFCVLPSNQSFETEVETTIFVSRADNSVESDGLPPGEYFLQVVVSTWPHSESLAERVRDRWRAFGLLWSDDIKSEPMQFRIDSDRPTRDCSAN
jgi:hypothetical protein